MTKHMSRRKRSRARSRRRTKQRKTFTLSPESVGFLERLSADRVADSGGPESVSAVLDGLLLAIDRDRARQDIEDKIGSYYDERSNEERQEEIDWGNLATGEFVAIELTKKRS